jgi:hypothetical protein
MTPTRPARRAAATPPDRSESATSHAATAAAGSGSEVPDILHVDPESEKHQLKRLIRFKENRDGERV